jgi:hypothetical protein
MKITVATMDRAISLAMAETSRAAVWNDRALRNRAIYLRGLEDAAKVEDPQRDEDRKKGITKVLLHTTNAWDNGHDAHADAIRETAKRLLKEIGK